MAVTIEKWEQPNGWPASNMGTPDVRNNRHCTAFDPSTNESVDFASVMPIGYAGGNLEVRIRCATDATSGDVDWDAQFEDAGGLDLDTDSFAAVQSTDNTTVPATAGTEFSVTITFTNAQADSVAAGDYYRLRITRDAVSDTCASDVQVFAVELRQ